MGTRRKLTLEDASAVKDALRPMARLFPGEREPEVRFQSREHTVQQISALWQKARDSFIEIGRWLNVARAAMQHGEWEEMVESDLPFTPARARQLRQVAEFVDSGLLPVEELPPHDTVVLELARLTPDQLASARRENLIRPDVRRSEIQAFRRKHRSDILTKEPDGEAEALRAERDRLLARIAAIDARLSELQA